MSRLTAVDGQYYMHTAVGEAVSPRKWEEAGWTQPAPQLPGLEIELDEGIAPTKDEKCRELLAIALLAMFPHPFIKIERETTPDWGLKQQINDLKAQTERGESIL